MGLTLSLVTLVLISIFQVRFKDADISDAYVSGWGLRQQKDCTTIDKVHSEQDKKKLIRKIYNDALLPRGILSPYPKIPNPTQYPKIKRHLWMFPLVIVFLIRFEILVHCARVLTNINDVNFHLSG